MTDSGRISASCAPLRFGARRGAGRLYLLLLSRPRLISNLLALVALFSIGFV